MFSASRNSGVELVGKLSWGSHFCQLYRTDDDLLDVLLPYFMAGLADNELCLWLVPEGDRDTVAPRLRACLGEPLATEQLTIMTCRQWHELESATGNGIFTLLDRAIMAGFDGMRIAWTLSEGELSDPAIGRAIDTLSGLNVLALFSYPHDRLKAPDLMEVIRSHLCALVRKPDGWDLIRSSEAHGVKDELKRQREKLHFLYSNMSEAFAYHRVVLDSRRQPCDYVFVEINEAFETMTGLKGADIVGKRLTELLPGIEHDPADWIGRFGAVALTGEPVRFESYSVPLGRWYAVSAFSPQKGYFAVMFSDITRRKQTEQQLQEKSEQVRRKLDAILSPAGDLGNLDLADIVDAPALQGLVDDFYQLTQLPMGLIDITGKVLVSVGWQDLCTKFHRTNPASCANCIESDIFLSAGVPPGEFKVYKCKNNLWDVVTPIIVGGKHQGNLFMGQFFFEDEPIDYDFFRDQARHFGFDKATYLDALNAVPRMGRETLATSMAFFMKLSEILSRLGYSNLRLARSLTERDTLMEELRQAKEVAEAATRTKSQFLANMSHELRTPMTGVLGMLEFALEGPLEGSQREYIEIAQRSARSLLRILNDILDLSRVESGKVTIEEAAFELRPCIASALDIIIPEIRCKGLALAHEVADDVPAIVVGDQMRLLQVLTNLCGNAVKFTSQGGIEVRVATGTHLPDGRREIVFTVTDSGIGIPADKKEALFKPFSQLDDSNTRKFGGTGLGLAISKELLTLMGGTISLESAEGEGSRFTFTVPFREAPRPAQAEAAVTRPLPEPLVPPVTGSRPRILLAEDDPVTRQLLGLLFSRLNFDLDVAEDGVRVLEMWEGGGYDLVLMDVQMPLMDGFATTRAIRERERSRGGHTIIVAMTAHAFAEDQEKCHQAGMDSYLSKPLDLQQCIARIRSLLGSAPA